ncbi:MAG TPA: hypothetical protein PLI57_08080 [Spirochaetota bacterium]|nr:hypothetical protein [Spirochaetota bacterium]
MRRIFIGERRGGYEAHMCHFFIGKRRGGYAWDAHSGQPGFRKKREFLF